MLTARLGLVGAPPVVRNMEGMWGKLIREEHARDGSLTALTSMSIKPWLRTGAGILITHTGSGVTLRIARRDGTIVLWGGARIVTQVNLIRTRQWLKLFTLDYLRWTFCGKIKGGGSLTEQFRRIRHYMEEQFRKIFGRTPDWDKQYLIQWKVLDFMNKTRAHLKENFHMHVCMYLNMQVCTSMQWCKQVRMQVEQKVWK